MRPVPATLPAPVLPAWRRAVRWLLSAPGCGITIKASGLGTRVLVHADENRFPAHIQGPMLARVELRGASGQVRKFKSQVMVIVTVQNEENPFEDEED